MITPTGNFKFYVATKPVDFRKGMDGLAAIILNEFDLDPFSGAVFIFRSKRADRLKLIVWDGTGLIMTYKRIEGKGFEWPRMTDGVIDLTRAQFEALFEGLDWKRVTPRGTRRPVAA
ncbi:IS66 family insertion sequence element accessory protein TnpB [Octadecabacter ascidiaceicola]|uniref:IS66 Orf2 like protein n=1 Tax=Octadecabacter ascidiaceicola TaxID=1655543 RepID=A0A238KI36_9RHOB|nr:IS66 family insertion sequence element accessory protein TnpB [Octadecabacter ascidiaceicola]SMX42400.1 IS66 Orf2 like protein [Octadecabacter ascidiaceicola]